MAVAGAALGAAGPAQAGPLTVAAYYYAWYGPAGSHWDKGYVRGRLEAPQAPLLGEYDSRDPATIEAHYTWARRYGVDVFLCSWWGPGGYDDLTVRDHLLPSPARGETRIGVLYESIQRLGLGPDNRIHLDEAAIATLVQDFDHLARTLFRRPGYYRIGGRPVVVLYVSRIFTGAVAEAIRAIRDHVRLAHGLELYLVGDEVDWDMRPEPARIRLYDAVTGYTLYSRTQRAGWPGETRYLTAVARRMRQFRDVARREGVRFVPGVLPGFNDRGVRPEAGHYVLPHELGPARTPSLSLFARFLEIAGRLVDPRLRLLTVTSWNEWHEDTQIEPTAPAAPSGGPPDATGGYAYESYGLALLERLARFKQRWEAAYRARLR